ncbi:MAG: hypothetical protein V3W14_12365 [Candidatus Neomarinimicrobiota bacterium]
MLLLLLLPRLLAAQAKYAGELFEFPGDARSVAMGGAGVADTHEAATGFFNPALVGLTSRTSLVLAHREQFGGVVNAELAATSLGANGPLALQLGVIRRGVDRIPDTRQALDDRDGDGELDDDERLIPERIRYFNQREWGVLFSLAPREQTGWCWGLSAKLLGHWLADELGLGMGFDLGLWRKLGTGLSAGALFQDITTTQVHWSTGRWETTAPRVTAGLRWAFTLPVVNRAMVLEGELTSRLDGERLERSFQIGSFSFLSRLGAEVELNDNLSLRAGGSTIYPFSLGLGLDFSAFRVDYAYLSDTVSRVFEPTHQITLVLYLEKLRSFLGAE